MPCKHWSHVLIIVEVGNWCWILNSSKVAVFLTKQNVIQVILLFNWWPNQSFIWTHICRFSKHKISLITLKNRHNLKLNGSRWILANYKCVIEMFKGAQQALNCRFFAEEAITCCHHKDYVTGYQNFVNGNQMTVFALFAMQWKRSVLCFFQLA